MIPGGSIANLPAGELVSSSEYAQLRETLFGLLTEGNSAADLDAAKRQVCFWLAAEFGETQIARGVADEMASAGRLDDALTWLQFGADLGDVDAKACLGLALVVNAQCAADRINGAAWWCAALSEGAEVAEIVRSEMAELLSAADLLEAARLSRRLVNRVN